jgi:predicted dehydrogenase
MATGRKRYAIVGMGGRVVMYTDAVVGRYKDRAELVGICDTSQVRMDWHNKRMQERFGLAKPAPTYPASKFRDMIRETRAEVVFVTTPDAFHHEYAIAAMELGCDVICEKPVTTDAPKLNALFEAVKRTGKSLRVTHNMRYAPACAALKEIVASGKIGRPLNVDLQWMLDTAHGADYFRRWHRDKHISGGLLIHKASHHFDAVNWWIDSYPKRVFCMGELKFYGKQNAEARGEKYSYSRYTGVPEAKDDPFAYFLDEREDTKGLYLAAEKETGYIRDRNVMGEPITIEDTVAISAKYKNGVIFSYSLVAYCPWEGMRVSITGTKGRAELFQRHGTHFITGQSQEELAAQQESGSSHSLRYIPMFGEPQEVMIPEAKGSHGGSDDEILERIFDPNPQPDPLRRDASLEEGAAAVLLGIAANESIRTGLPVECDSLCPLPAR